MGPFYPIINDGLWIAYHNFSGQYKNGLQDGHRFELYDSQRCKKFKKYSESAKIEMSYSERHHYQMLHDANTGILCRELSFYCVDLETNEISGPRESTSQLKQFVNSIQLI